MREFTANVAGNDLVRDRLYGALVGSGEIGKPDRAPIPPGWGRSARNTRILERQPRVISHEQQMRFS
jgi:hypothetical protein